MTEKLEIIMSAVKSSRNFITTHSEKWFYFSCWIGRILIVFKFCRLFLSYTLHHFYFLNFFTFFKLYLTLLFRFFKLYLTLLLLSELFFKLYLTLLLRFKLFQCSDWFRTRKVLRFDTKSFEILVTQSYSV